MLVAIVATGTGGVEVAVVDSGNERDVATTGGGSEGRW
jgi:hypothetical protein